MLSFGFIFWLFEEASIQYEMMRLGRYTNIYQGKKME
jgi:hypothetical protein